MSDSDPSSESTPVKPWLEVVGSRYFMDWLAEQQTSLAFSTYQTGKMFFIGRKPNNQLAVSRTINWAYSNERMPTAWDYARVPMRKRSG